MFVNGVALKKLRFEIENSGYTASPATVLSLIQLAERYLFLSRCDSQIRLEIAESDDMGAGYEYLDIAIDKAMKQYNA